MSTFVHWYYHRHQTRLEFPWFSEPWIFWIMLMNKTYIHTFLPRLVPSHLFRAALNQNEGHYCILNLRFSFFKWYSGSRLSPKVTFDCLYLIPYFRKMFLISVWLIESIRLSSFDTYPASPRNDHVEKGKPYSFLGFLVAISIIFFSIISLK